MRIGGREFDTDNRTYIMGILNVTPDSFSDGGQYNRLDSALRRAEQMTCEGADLIDIGGESTRPGYTPLSWEEEAERVIPVVEAVKKRFDIPVSLDTYKSRVAAEGILAGADLINDVWGLKKDGDMAYLLAETGKPCCLMHNREDMDYGNFMEDLLADLRQTLKLADQAGIRRDRIILDPGVGFAKSLERNLETIRSLGRLKELGQPVLLGASRKSVVGLTLDLPVRERLEGTLVTTVFAVLGGCAFVRVHDVLENRRAVSMAEAILGKTKERAGAG